MSFKLMDTGIKLITSFLMRLPSVAATCLRLNDLVGSLPLDLHVLGTPPAFILSQDQTLQKRYHLPLRAHAIKEFVLTSVETDYIFYR
jgi:hypothetical protein